MSINKYEPGDRMSQEQEDFAAGRLDFQKEAALEAKKVRGYIIAHPGCNSKQIREGLALKTASNALDWLIRRKLIRSTMFGYEVVPQ